MYDSGRCARPGRARANDPPVHLEPAGTLDLLPLSSGGKTHAGFLQISDPDHFDFHCVEGCQQNILELHSRLLAAVGTIATAQGHVQGELPFLWIITVRRTPFLCCPSSLASTTG